MTLISIGGGHSLSEPAGLSYKRAQKAGLPVGITSSTRSYPLQNSYYIHQGEPGYPALADNPDKSKHVDRPDDTKDKGARALDLPAGGPREWMHAHGAYYGWFARIKSEKWHFEYEWWNDQSRLDSPSTPVVPLPIPPPEPEKDEDEEEDIDMERIVQALIERHLGTKLDPANAGDRVTLNFWLDFYSEHGREALQSNIAGAPEAHRWSVDKRYITEMGRAAENVAALDTYWTQFGGDLNAITLALRNSVEGVAFHAKSPAERNTLISAALAGRVLG